MFLNIGVDKPIWYKRLIVYPVKKFHFRIMKKIFLFLFLSATVFKTKGQIQTYDITTYKLSKDWKIDNSNTNALQLIKTNEATGSYCIITISKALPVIGSALQDYKTTWAKTVTETVKATLPSDANIQTEKRKDGRTLIGAVSTFKNEAADNAIILYTISSTENKIAITVVTNSNEYGNAIDKFTDDLVITKGKAIKPVTPIATTTKAQTITTNNSSIGGKLKDNAIAGVWVIYSKPSITESLQWSWFVFFNDGRSLQNLPNGGFYNVQAGKYYDETKNTPSVWPIGTYTFSNGVGKNKKTTVSNYQENLTLVKTNQLSINGTNYFKCKPVDGINFSGSYTSYSNAQDPQLQTLPYGEKPVITFNKNGTFRDEGIFKVLLKDYSKSEEFNGPGDGKYWLSDYSLILLYNDGRQRQETFTIPFSNDLEKADIILISRAQINKIK